MKQGLTQEKIKQINNIIQTSNKIQLETIIKTCLKRLSEIEKTIEKKVYPGWAYSKNESEKSKINREIYSEIKDKAKVKLIRRIAGANTYEVVENKENLSNDELALICDDGNLCFGYRMEGDEIVIHTD